MQVAKATARLSFDEVLEMVGSLTPQEEVTSTPSDCLRPHRPGLKTIVVDHGQS